MVGWGYSGMGGWGGLRDQGIMHYGLGDWGILGILRDLGRSWGIMGDHGEWDGEIGELGDWGIGELRAQGFGESCGIFCDLGRS